MTKPRRAELEKLVTADLRALTAGSDRIGRVYAKTQGVTYNDFAALLTVFVAETAGAPLTGSQLGQRMGVSNSAITYFVDRMTQLGHVRREPDQADRRKVVLRYGDHGMALARAFFTPLGQHVHAVMADLPYRDLAAAHRVFTALITAMSRFEDEIGQ